MNITNLIATLENAVNSQLMLGGSDPSVDAAAQAILVALTPTAQAMALELAQQAAAEVEGQLPDHEVEVLLVDGDPHLRVRAIDMEPEVGSSDYEARLTLRLPDQLKQMVEDAAGQSGNSVNSWVVKALSKDATKRRAKGSQVTGSFEL